MAIDSAFPRLNRVFAENDFFLCRDLWTVQESNWLGFLLAGYTSGTTRQWPIRVQRVLFQLADCLPHFKLCTVF